MDYLELQWTWIAAWWATNTAEPFETWASHVVSLHPADEYEITRCERVLGVEVLEVAA